MYSLFPKLVITLVILTVFSLTYSALFSNSGLPSGHDIRAHAINSRLFVDAVSQGQFPPRFTEWVKNGYSLPLFNFYEVGFYYPVSLIFFLTHSITLSIKIAVLVFWWLGGYLMFTLVRKYGFFPALTAAIIFMFTPYLIADIFVRAAYPEFASICLAPGLIWAFERLLLGVKLKYLLLLSLFLFLILIIRPPTLIILLPIIVFYGIILFLSSEAKTSGLKGVFWATLLGVGLSSFYILPALFELPFVNTNLLRTGFFDFHHHFVNPILFMASKWGYGGSGPGQTDPLSLSFGIIQWIIIIISIFASRARPKILFWLGMIILAIYFMIDLSAPLWEHLPFLDYIQFPWRFLADVAIACSLLAAILVSLDKSLLRRSFYCLLSLILIIVFYGKYLAPLAFLPEQYFNLDSSSWRQSPGVAKDPNMEKSFLPKEVKLLPDQSIGRWTILRGIGVFHPKLLLNHYLSFDTDTNQGLTLEVNSHYFPGWEAYIDNVKTDILPTQDYDFMDVQIPSGKYFVEFKFNNTPIRTTGNTISIISILIFASLVKVRKVK